MFYFETAVGPRWVVGFESTLAFIARESVLPLSPLLRDLLSLPHVVGLGEISRELVWLVDTLRFVPRNDC
jgi:hypothetical protein